MFWHQGLQMLLFTQVYNFIDFLIELCRGNSWQIRRKHLIRRGWLGEIIYSIFLLKLLSSAFVDGCACLIHFQNQIFLFKPIINFLFIIIVLVSHCPSSKYNRIFITLLLIVFIVLIHSSINWRELLNIILV